MNHDPEKWDANFAPRQVEAGVQWVDVRELGVEGRAFADTASFYDRWPGRAKEVLPEEVWSIGEHSAGICARWVTDATQISARWTLRRERRAMDHMPATGVSGLDLYTRTPHGWRWLGVGRPTAFPANQAPLTSGHMTPEPREMMLYLPLYNGVAEVLIGVPEGARVQRAAAWSRPKTRPLCFYGTSIVNGGCASRPGMTYPAIIGRRLDWPHYNFGFSGNGRCEPEVAQLLAELDPAAYVIDALPNMTAELIAQRMEPFLSILRQAHPATPIVLVESIAYQDEYAVTTRRQRSEASNATLRRAFEHMVGNGMNGLHYVPGGKLLGTDGEGTVDGTHPTDSGFLRMADAIGPALAEQIGS